MIVCDQIAAFRGKLYRQCLSFDNRFAAGIFLPMSPRAKSGPALVAGFRATPELGRPRMGLRDVHVRAFNAMSGIADQSSIKPSSSTKRACPMSEIRALRASPCLFLRHIDVERRTR